MNYLAHALLSAHSEDLLIGNFIADHIRGNHYTELPAPIIEGIKMHRQIDHFTDTHLIFKESKRFFYPHYEKHSGILIDIYFDHLLAKNFSLFSAESLSDFSTKTYAAYNRNLLHLPEHSRRFLNYLIRNDLYVAYSQQEGISTVLQHLSQRINHGVQLENSMDFFVQKEDLLTEMFFEFFEDAKNKFTSYQDKNSL